MPKFKPETIAKRQAQKAANQVASKLEEAIKQLDSIIASKAHESDSKPF